MNLNKFYYQNFKTNKSELILKKNNLNNKKVLFLDRDGIIIEDIKYIDSPEKVLICKNVISFLKNAVKKNFDLVIVTNQSSISRGIINYEDYLNITSSMLEKLEEEIYPNFILASFHLPDNSNQLGDFEWRKPNSGMFKYILEKNGYDVKKSIMVGDKLTDLIPAYKCNIVNLHYVQSSLHKEEIIKVNEWNKKNINLIKIKKELTNDILEII